MTIIMDDLSKNGFLLFLKVYREKSKSSASHESVDGISQAIKRHLENLEIGLLKGVMLLLITHVN